MRATKLDSRRVEALRSDDGELVRREHGDAAALELYPAALFPRPQLLVGALARHADHLADLALRDRRLALCRGPLFARARQLQQGLCQAGRQVEERDVLDLLARVAQPRAENLDELEHHVRVAVEQGDFAEHLALAKYVEHDVLALGGRDADFDAPGKYPHESGAGISLS